MSGKEQQRPEFSSVVDHLEARARVMLDRWAALGSSSIRIDGRGRFSDDEFIARVQRLQARTQEILLRVAETSPEVISGKRSRSLGSILGIARDAMVGTRNALLDEAEGPMRVERAWLALSDATDSIKAEAIEVAELLDRGPLELLTQQELQVLAEAEAEEGGTADLMLRLASLAARLEDASRASSEARIMLDGRFHWPGGKGRPAKVRGRRLAAHLLGLAEGLGLPTARNHEPSPGRPLESAADAVIEALLRCKDVSNPVAREIVAETPASFTTLVRRLLPLLRDRGDDQDQADPALVASYRDGYARGASSAVRS